MLDRVPEGRTGHGRLILLQVSGQCGWMLREIGKRDRDALTGYLLKNKAAMSRTTLRYAIERYPEPERKTFLAR